VNAGGIEIPDEELLFTTSRSGGPGGQNVNKVSTRVTLLFDVERSPSLSEEQRGLIRSRLSRRINRQGVLKVTSQRHRTQSANRDAAVARFAGLLAEALADTPERVPTRVPPQVNERRLNEKRRRGRLKQDRGVDPNQEDWGS
jgi:ribosome-associated protein